MPTNASIQTPQHNIVEVCSARMQNRPTFSADRRSWRSIGRPPWPFARRWCCRNRHGSLTLSKRRFQAGARHAAAHEFTRDGHSPPQITKSTFHLHSRPVVRLGSFGGSGQELSKAPPLITDFIAPAAAAMRLLQNARHDQDIGQFLLLPCAGGSCRASAITCSSLFLRNRCSAWTAVRSP